MKFIQFVSPGTKNLSHTLAMVHRKLSLPNIYFKKIMREKIVIVNWASDFRRYLHVSKNMTAENILPVPRLKVTENSPSNLYIY